MSTLIGSVVLVLIVAMVCGAWIETHGGSSSKDRSKKEQREIARLRRAVEILAGRVAYLETKHGEFHVGPTEQAVAEEWVKGNGVKA